MKTNYIQSLLSINAARITELHNKMDIARLCAKQYKADGETAFAVEQYLVITRSRRTLGKAVEIQMELKAQLAYNQRVERIRTLYVKEFGAQPNAGLLTSVEAELLLQK